MNLRWLALVGIGVLVLGACDGGSEPGEENPAEMGGEAGAPVGSGGASSGKGGASAGQGGTSSQGGAPAGEGGASGEPAGEGGSTGEPGGAGDEGGAAGSDPGEAGGGGASTGSAGSTGTAGSSSGTAGAAGGGTAAGACSLELNGATGKEPGKKIPACCEPTGDEKAEIMAVFKLVNAHRAKNGKPALAYDEKLEAAMQGHCVHMATHSFFSHSSPESAVAKFSARAKLCGTSAGAENIAKGQSSAQAVMNSWITSPGHNTNMLGNYKRIGICKKGSYWGQIFGG